MLLWRPQGLFGSTRSTGTRTRLHLPKEAIAVAVLAAVAVVPYVADAYWLLLAINILTYVALATAWAFFSGPTRYVSLAASAFYGLGAYCVAVLATDYSYPVALIAAVGFTAVLSAFVGLATLRLSGMYFVIFTFGLASLVSAAATWWEFNIAKSSGWYVFLTITDDADLLPAARAVRGDHRAVALARPHPHGRRAHHARRRRDRGAPDRHQHHRTQDRDLRRERGDDGAGRRHPGPANSYMTAPNVFNPELSFLTVISALLGGATSVWGPMLGVMPLMLVKDYLSIAYSSQFSVLLGLILLGIVFFIPDGIIGLLRIGPRRAQLAQARRRASRRSPAACEAAGTAASPRTRSGAAQRHGCTC